MNLMKKIAIALALTVGTVSCSACGKKLPEPQPVEAGVTPAPAPPVTPPPPPAPTTKEVSLGGLSVTLPNTSYNEMTNAPPNAKAFMSTSPKSLVVLIEEPFEGSFDEYAIVAILGARRSGATVHSAKQVTVNGTNFVLVESSKDSITIWMWVTTKDGRGFGLSCGGPDEATQRALCTSIINTVKVN